MVGTLTKDAARRALAARLRFKFELDTPCDVYELICKCGLSLRFTNTATLDGMYINDGLAGSINVSALRPSGHQRFTAAHELGHFIFGHGARLDRSIENMTSVSDDETVADTFARHLLMPKRSVLRGFGALGTRPSDASPTQYYRVASWLGVGYSTLVQHARWTLKLIDTHKLHTLTLAKPQTIKRNLLPSQMWTGRRELWPLAPWWHGAKVHLQVGDVLLGLKSPDPKYFTLGDGCAVASAVGRFEADLAGIGIVTLNISQRDYFGMYQYRYLEEPTDA